MAAVRGIWTARIGGALAGLAAAGALLILSHPAQGGAAVGAELTAHADQSGELAVSPAGPADFLHVRALRPGEARSGGFTVTNQTGQTQLVRATARPSDPKLAPVIRLRVDQASLVLAPGQSGTLTATASLARRPGDRWQAALIDYALVLHSRDAR
jgi:hypothetical protein